MFSEESLLRKIIRILHLFGPEERLRASVDVSEIGFGRSRKVNCLEFYHKLVEQN
jgi:hypothetical protein